MSAIARVLPAVRTPIAYAITFRVAQWLLALLPGRPFETLVAPIALIGFPASIAWAGWRVIELRIGGIGTSVVAGLVMNAAYCTLLAAEMLIRGEPGSLLGYLVTPILWFGLFATSSAFLAAVGGFAAQRRFKPRDAT